MINKSLLKSVNMVDDFYIPHSSIESALKGIRKSILLSSNSKEPVCTVLTGPAGSGKTTTCEIIVQEYKRSLELREGKEVWITPAFYSSIPSPVTIKGVASAMLNSIGDPAPTKGTCLDLTYRLGRLLSECETKVIILDELHHLFGKYEKGNDNVVDWLKTIINQFKVSVVIVGMEECNKVVDQSAQLSRRFSNRYKLRNLLFDSQGSEFQLFIKDLGAIFKSNTSISMLPDFDSKHCSLALFLASRGNPSDLVKLFKFATISTLENKKEVVSIDSFRIAFNQLSLPNAFSGNKNPFECEEKDLETMLTNIQKKKGVA